MVVIMRLLLGLCAVALGGVGLWLAIAPGSLVDELRFQLGSLTNGNDWLRFTIGAWGALLVLLPIGLAWRAFRSRRHAAEIRYQTEMGEVSVSLQAIEEALTRAIDQLDSVRKVALKIFQDRVRRQVVIKASLILWDDGDVTGSNWRCQEIIRERFRELMPEQEDFRIDVNVHRLNQRRATDTNLKGPVEAPAGAEQVATTPTPERDRRDSDPVPLPGLSATHGRADNEAGAALLAARKGTHRGGDTDRIARQDREATDGGGDSASASDAVAALEPVVDEEVATEVEETAVEEAPEDEYDSFENLYVGPQYTVEEDDEDEQKG